MRYPCSCGELGVIGKVGKEFRDGELGARGGRMWVKGLQLWKILDAQRTEKVLEHLC